MLSTATSSTITTITSVAALGLEPTLALGAIAILLVLLVQKNIAAYVAEGWLAKLSGSLNIPLLPLGFAFVVIAGVKIIQILG